MQTVPWPNQPQAQAGRRHTGAIDKAAPGPALAFVENPPQNYSIPLDQQPKPGRMRWVQTVIAPQHGSFQRHRATALCDNQLVNIT
jgi:hypothetical protein